MWAQGVGERAANDTGLKIDRQKKGAGVSPFFVYNRNN